MDAPVVDAVQALYPAVAGLLLPARPELTPGVQVNPVKSHPSGIGGYVGLRPVPRGQIHARRLQAQVVIRVKADSVRDLGVAESAVANAPLTASNLAGIGLVGLALEVLAAGAKPVTAYPPRIQFDL
jgi:hypothetical protein